MAGPPVSVVEPASTPNSGGRSKPIATAMPSRFCATAKIDASTRNTTTCLPLMRSRRTLALKPMVVKNATISGVCRLVSSVNSTVPRECAAQAASANTRPPITGGGRL